MNTVFVSCFDPISQSPVEKSSSVQVSVDAIPEPATLMFLGVGLIGLLALTRRRWKRKQ